MTGRAPRGDAEVTWSAVAGFRREEEARIVAGRLEAEGVEARIFPEFQASYYEGIEGMWQPFRVLVPAHREPEARAILERLRSG